MTRDIGCRLLRQVAEIDAIAGEWDRLWRAQPIRHVFQSYAWHRAILDAHGADRDPCVVVAYDGARLVGVLPLAVLGGMLRFLGAPYGDYNDLLTDALEPAGVLRSMIEALHGAGLRRAELENVRDDSCLRRAAGAIQGGLGKRLHWTPGERCPTTLLETQRDGVLASILKNKSLRRHERKLAQLGAVAFRHVDDPRVARTLLPEFFAQHTARRAMAGGGLLFERPAARRFYEALVSRLAPELLRFAVLDLDGAPVAFHFGFECDRRFVFYKPAFMVDLWEYSPGAVLLKRLFEYAGAHELVEFDFTRGEEPFKSHFANASRLSYTLRLLRPGPAGALAGLWLTWKERLERRAAFFRVLQRQRIRAAAVARALRRPQVLPRVWRRVVRAWRRWVYARDEMLLFHLDASGVAPARTDPLEVRQGRLAELARLATAHPDEFDASRLQRARMRLRSGDRLFLARWEGELAHVAWLGLRRTIAPTEVGPDLCLPLEREGAVVYDCWTPPAMRGRALYPGTLRAITAASPVPDVWIFCDPTNLPSRSGILSAGFAESHRMRRTRWFGRRVRTSVEALSDGKEPGSQRRSASVLPRDT